MFTVKTFNITLVFEVFFFKKLVEVLLLVCQNLLSVHVQLLLTNKVLRVFAFVLSYFNDFKFIKKLVSNRTKKLYSMPMTAYGNREQDSVLSFENQGTKEEFTERLRLDKGGVEPTQEEIDKWLDPVTYQPTFSRARTYLKHLDIEYYLENLPPVDTKTTPEYDPSKNQTLIHRKSSRKLIWTKDPLNFYIKKIYSFVFSRSSTTKTIKYFKKKQKISMKSINLLKSFSRENYYWVDFVFNRLQYTSESLKKNKLFSILGNTKKLKQNFIKTKLTSLSKNLNIKLNRVENYITKVLYKTYISWYLTHRFSYKVHLHNYTGVYYVIFEQLKSRVYSKTTNITLYLQSIQSRLLKFIYKKEFGRLIAKSLVDKTVCYFYVHRLLLSLLLLDLSLIVNFIAVRIHKTKKTKRLQKQMLNLFKRIFSEFRRHMSLHFVGFYFQIKGKLKGKRRKSRWLFKIGAFPLTQDTLDYSYCYSQAVSRFGAYGVSCQLITKKQ